MNNNIKNKELETAVIQANNFNAKIEPTLGISEVQIYTILGSSAENKEIYANGVMDIDVQLVITFTRELTEEENNHFNAWPNICLGYYDEAIQEMVFVNTNPSHETYFIEEPGFYTGMRQNRVKEKEMFHQRTINEQTIMEKDFPEILEVLKKNNYNYYEAYGNKLEPKKFLFTTTMRAGPNTPSRVMSFRVIMPDNRIILTHDTGNGFVATLKLSCLNPPSVTPRNSGINIFNDQHVSGYELNIWACGVVGLDLDYLGYGVHVEVFAIYSRSSDIIEFEQNNFLSDYPLNFWYLPETGFRFNGSNGYLDTSPTHLHTFYNWRTEISGNSGGRIIYSRKSFSISNPYRIFYDTNARNFYMSETPRGTYHYEDIYLTENNQFGVRVIDIHYPTSNLGEFFYQPEYGARIFVTQTTEHDRNGVLSLTVRPDQDKFSIVYDQYGFEGHASMLIFVMDRYGTRHNLTLKDVTLYDWHNLQIPMLTQGLSIE